MHLLEFRQIVHDAEVANVISPVVRGNRLTEEETEEALLELRIPRAANVAGIIFGQAGSFISEEERHNPTRSRRLAASPLLSAAT